MYQQDQYLKITTNAMNGICKMVVSELMIENGSLNILNQTNLKIFTVNERRNDEKIICKNKQC